MSQNLIKVWDDFIEEAKTLQSLVVDRLFGVEVWEGKEVHLMDFLVVVLVYKFTKEHAQLVSFWWRQENTHHFNKNNKIAYKDILSHTSKVWHGGKENSDLVITLGIQLFMLLLFDAHEVCCHVLRQNVVHQRLVTLSDVCSSFPLFLHFTSPQVEQPWCFLSLGWEKIEQIIKEE